MVGVANLKGNLNRLAEAYSGVYEAQIAQVCPQPTVSPFQPNFQIFREVQISGVCVNFTALFVILTRCVA